jgi:hypothetical protein
MSDKFRVRVYNGWGDWEDYFCKFYNHCVNIANENNWKTETVVNYKLRPWGGKLIKTKTQGWYLRWDKESSHTFFILRWS